MARDHRLVIQVVGDTRQAEKSLRRLKVEVAGFRRGLAQGLGFGAATVGVAGFGLAVRNAVQSFGDFQQSLQRMVGLSGVAQKAISGLRNDVLALAPSVGKGPQELADALFFITSSGIPAARALDVLTVSAKASAAGLGETQVVADAVTSALNAYGPAVLSASQATDVLVATVREGKGEADQFAGVIGNVAAIAAELGVGFDQVGAALAAQTRLGTDAETAATQLNQVFNAFLNTSPQVAKAFESVGLNLNDLRRTLREQGLLAALTQVKEGFGNNTVALRQAIPEIRAFRGVLALVGKQAGPVRGIFDRLAKSTGSLESAFGAISKTQAQQFAKLNASLQVFKITVGAALAPAINDVLVPLNKWLSQTKNQKKVQKELTDTVKGVVGGVRDLVNALKPLAEAAKKTSDQLGGLQNTLKLLLTVFVVGKVVKYASAIGGLGTAAATSTGQVIALRAALLRLGTIGVITLGVEILLNKDAIDKKVKGFLRENGLGFLTGGQIKISPDVDLTGLEALRNKIADSVGETDLMVKALDKVIARLREAHAIRTVEPGEGNLGGTQLKHGIKTPPTVVTPDNDKSVKDSAKTGANAGNAAKKAFERVIGTLEIALASAQQTRSLRDDLAILKQMEATLRARAAVAKNDLDVQRQLVDVLGQQKEIQAQIRQNQAETRKSNLFKALGLTAEGEERTASISAIRKRGRGLIDELKASDIDPAKVKSFVRRISVIFTKQFDGAGKEIRQAILDMFHDIADALDEGTKKGPLTKTSGLNTKRFIKSLGDIGLTADQKRALRGGLSHLNTAGQSAPGSSTAGSGTFVVETTVNLDGQKVAQSTTRHQQRATRRNPKQKRGPNRKN